MRRQLSTLLFGLCLLPLWAHADEDAVAWLGRIAMAGQKQNYSGTFIYQSGTTLETSRIVHKVDERGEHERLEVLDGSPREVIRSNNQVYCVLPDVKMVIRDRSAKSAFPARVPSAYAGLSEHYSVSVAGSSRVAGYAARLIVLEPKDELRYGHQLWADSNSGLLLKARTLGVRGEVVEQFSFSDVTIGGEITAAELAPRYQQDDTWRVLDAQSNLIPHSEQQWVLAEPLPGYVQKSASLRSWREPGQAITHIVFSDGLASISVFIEAEDAEAAQRWSQHLAKNGAINIYKRRHAGHLITVLGEAPEEALRLIGDGMQFARQ